MDKVIHFEIPADNLERAKKFYQSIFGWQLTDMPEINYTGVTTVPTDSRHMPKEPGAINGEMYKRTKLEEPSTSPPSMTTSRGSRGLGAKRSCPSKKSVTWASMPRFRTPKAM